MLCSRDAKPNKRRISTRLEFLRGSRDERGKEEEGGEERGGVPIGAVRVSNDEGMIFFAGSDK